MKKIKIIVTSILFCFHFSNVWAYDFSAVTNGQKLYFNILSDSPPYTVEVTSQRREYPFYDTCPSGNLTIPSSVSYGGITYSVIQIGDNAFYESLELTTVSIPNTVTSIDTFAFGFCNTLTTLTLSESLVNIKLCAFSNCRQLQAIDLPNSLTDIGVGAFICCFELTDVLIPAGVKSIGYSVFYKCEKLTAIQVASNNTNYKSEEGILYTYSMDTLVACPGAKSGKLVIPEGVKYIGYDACGSCEKLTSVEFPNSVIKIDGYAFDHCKGLTGSLILPQSLQYIGRSSFYACSEISDTLKIPDSVIIIDKYAFYDCTGLKFIQFGRSIEVIKLGAFLGCENVQGKLVIPDNIKRIENDAFMNCENITSVIIGDSINYIGECAFYYCISLNDVTIGTSIKKIDMAAFYSNVKEVTIRSVFPPETVYKTFNFALHEHILYVPCGSESYYQNDTEWNKFTEIRGGNMDYMIDMNVNNDYYGLAMASAPDCITNQSVLKASPYLGYVFEKWSDGNTDNPRTAVITSDTSFTAIFKSEVAVEEVSENNNCMLYPNPVHTIVNIDNGEVAMQELLLYDVSGRLLKAISVHATQTSLDVSDLQNGIYLIKITTRDAAFVRKIQVLR